MCVAGDDALCYPDEPLTFLILDQNKVRGMCVAGKPECMAGKKMCMAVNETVRNETVIQKFP